MFILFISLALAQVVRGNNCVFGQFDFRPLAGKTWNLQDAGQGSTNIYNFSMCQNLPTQCSGYPGSPGVPGNMFSVSPSTSAWSPARCNRVISAWNTDPPFKNIYNGIQLTFSGGDHGAMCSPAYITAIVNIQCSSSGQILTGSVAQNMTNSCVYVASVFSKYACAPPTRRPTPPTKHPTPKPTPKPISGCTFQGINLAPLASKVIALPDKSSTAPFKYVITVCRNLPSICTDKALHNKKIRGNFYKLSKTNKPQVCDQIQSKWGHVRSSLNAYGGLVLSFHNGDPCGRGRRSVTMTFMCKPSSPVVTGYAYQDPKNACHTIAVMFTGIVC